MVLDVTPPLVWSYRLAIPVIHWCHYTDIEHLEALGTTLELWWWARLIAIWPGGTGTPPQDLELRVSTVSLLPVVQSSLLH